MSSLKSLITDPTAIFLDEEIVVINNFLPEDLLSTLLDIEKNATFGEWTSRANNLEGQWYASILPFEGEAADQVRRLCDEVFNYNYTFKHPMFIRRRRESEALLPHYDNQNQKSCEWGLVVYLNDEYDGGEIYYPNRNIEHKPVKNSLVIHSAGVDYTHGVRAVKNGTRLFMTLWAFYDDTEGL